MPTRRTVLCASISALAVQNVAAAIAGDQHGVARRYDIASIDLPEGSIETGCLNSHGLVVGSAFLGSPPEPRAFGWWKGTFGWLTPDDVPSVALAVDEQGNAVGWAAENHPMVRPVVWRDAMRGSPATDLAPLESSGGVASAIEADGEIYGFIQQPGSHVSLPVRFTERDPKHLGNFGGSGTPAAVNASGVVVGSASRDGAESSPTVAVRWVLLEIEELPTPDGSNSAARAINDDGIVVGEVVNASGGDSLPRATLWDGGGGELAMPDGYEASSATGIDPTGTVVGTASTGEGRDAIAVLWRDGRPLDLNPAIPPDVGVTLRGALAINRHGEILCTGWQGEDRRSVGFLLTPTPT